MAKLANSFATFDAVGNREQLTDKIYMVDPEDTPFISAIGRVRVGGVFEEWQTDELEPATNNKVVQGNEPTPNAVTPTDRLGNRTQISEKTFAVTGTQEAVQKAGRKSEISYQGLKKSVELKRDQDFAALQNSTAIAAASTVAPQSRGVLGFIMTNTNHGVGGVDPNPYSNTAQVDGAVRDLEESMVKDISRQLYANSDNKANSLFVPAAQREIVSSFSGGAAKWRDAQKNEVNTTVDVYRTDYGRFTVVNSRHQRDRDIFALNLSTWKLGILRALQEIKLAKTGDNEKRMVNMEWTLICENEKSNAAIRDLATDDNPVTP